MFELKSKHDDKAFVLYKTFKVADESNKYRLTIADYETSVAGDAMGAYNDVFFSTQDQDNSLDLNGCATVEYGGWWYSACPETSLTAKYATFSQYRRLKWHTWPYNQKVLSEAEMKTRTKSGKFPGVCSNSSYSFNNFY